MSRIYAAMGNFQGQENSAKLAIQNGTTYLSDAYVFVGDAYSEAGKAAGSGECIFKGAGIKAR
jgi:hypothetical protein